ncbi:MAG: hypothetical protein ACK578_16130, partial [Pirellula sp.]
MHNRLNFSSWMLICLCAIASPAISFASTLTVGEAKLLIGGNGIGDSIGLNSCYNKVPPTCFDCECSLLPTPFSPRGPGSGGPGGDCRGCSGPGDRAKNNFGFPWFSTEGSASNRLESTTGYYQSGNSVIDNYSLNYVHMALDLPQAIESGVMLQRTHRSRNLSEQSSFGPGVFGQYDISLDIPFRSSPIWIFDPANSMEMPFTSLSSNFIQYDARMYNANAGSIFLLQSDGVTPALIPSDTASDNNYWGTARCAALRGREGEKYVFELWEDKRYGSTSGYDAPQGGSSSGGEGGEGGEGVFEFGDGGSMGEGNGDSGHHPLKGRLIKIVDRVGRMITINYHFSLASLQNESTPSLKQVQMKEVVDSYGATIDFEYATTTIGGMWAIAKMTAPGNAETTYTYSNEKLTQVLHPDGSISTFTYGFDAESNCTTVVFSDPMAVLRGGHRNKTVYFTGGMSASLSGVWPVSVNCVRMVVNGENELSYLALPMLPIIGEYEYGFSPDPAFSKFIYEGGGKLKLISGSSSLGAGALVRSFLSGWTFATEDIGYGITYTSVDGDLEPSFAYQSGVSVRSGDPSTVANEAGITAEYEYLGQLFEKRWMNRKTYSDLSYETWDYNSNWQVIRHRDRIGNVTKTQYSALGVMTKRETGLIEQEDPNAPSGYVDIQTSAYGMEQRTYNPKSRLL